MTEHHRRTDAELVQGILLDDPGFLKEIVERVLQEMLEAEMTEHVGAAPYERSATRTGQRNGYKPRTLRSRVGTLNLLVPQDREGTFSTRLFSRYQRNEKALVLALMEMYVEGVSTRKVKDITEELCGISFSKSLVSSLAGWLDVELRAWRSRPLKAKAYPYLFVDARYEKARVGHRIVSQGVLIVSGVRDDGMREILAVEVADTESEATYHELFRSLKSRGLKEGSSWWSRTSMRASKRRLLVTSRGPLTRGARFTTRGTYSAWWATPSARSSPRTCGRSSRRRRGDRHSGSLRRWPRGGGRRAARRWPSTSRSR
jgi:transposase-like protein